MCEFETFVTKAIFGKAIFVSSSISPGWFITNSKTQYLLVEGSLDRVKERPIKLLLLPCVQCVAPYFLKLAAAIKRVLVLPLLPVIAIVSPLKLFLANF